MTFDLRQSMRNGGGPACLRLRVALDRRRARGDRAPTCFSTTRSPTRSTRWIRRHYRDRLLPADLGDPRSSTNRGARSTSFQALLRCRGVYPFQRDA